MVRMGFSLTESHPGRPSPGIFQENKSAPCTKAVPGGTAFSRPPAPAPLAHNGPFQGNLSLGEARYCPSYEKLQFIKPGIRRKRRRRMHRGEGTKKKKYFILKPPDQHTKKGPCPSAGESGLRLGCAGYYRAGIAWKEGTRLCPPLSKIIKDYACRLWERGCPAGAEGRGSKMRRRSNTT